MSKPIMPQNEGMGIKHKSGIKSHFIKIFIGTKFGHPITRIPIFHKVSRFE